MTKRQPVLNAEPCTRMCGLTGDRSIVAATALRCGRTGCIGGFQPTSDRRNGHPSCPVALGECRCARRRSAVDGSAGGGRGGGGGRGAGGGVGGAGGGENHPGGGGGGGGGAVRGPGGGEKRPAAGVCCSHREQQMPTERLRSPIPPLSVMPDPAVAA